MANTYDGGIVTAYGAAVRGGYNGTYEQFCTEQAQFGANAAAVAAAKIAVDSAKSQVDQTVNTFTQTTVPNAVSSVQSAGTEQIGLVQNAGTAQTQSVNSAGAAQVSAVQSEGSTQTHNVELTALSAIGQINDAQGDAVDAVETAETAATDAVTDRSPDRSRAGCPDGEHDAAGCRAGQGRANHRQHPGRLHGFERRRLCREELLVYGNFQRLKNAGW